MPSVAILVGDDVNIQEMINIMLDQNILNGISIEDCSENRESETKKCVRIFRLSDVKGMEFEVVFFYDIDKALEGQTKKMMRRYLYVGVSRATSHLAATFTQEEGNEEIIKYFDRTKRNWRIK
jgi:DNA helicase IV